MKKRGIKKDLFTVAIITVVTITVWVFLDVFLTFQKSSLSPVLEKQMAPLSPKLNTQVLDELEKKAYLGFTEENLPEVVITPAAEVPTGTESANF